MVLGFIRGASGCVAASHSLRSFTQPFIMEGTLSGASIRRRRASVRINSFDVDVGRPPERRMDGTAAPSRSNSATRMLSAGLHSQGMFRYPASFLRHFGQCFAASRSIDPITCRIQELSRRARQLRGLIDRQ
jgi:hypothetical protein